MAKTVQERRLALVIELTKQGTEPIQVSCRADYEVKSDDLTVTRSFVPALTQAQETAIKNFGVDVVNQIKAIEEG